MSRDNIYEKPQIRPATLARWARFRAAKQAAWEKAWKPVRLCESTGDPETPGVYEERPPDLHRFRTTDFKSFEAPVDAPTLEWEYSRKGDEWKTTEWEVGRFVCIASTKYDRHPDWDFVGDWLDKEPDSPARREGWIWSKDPAARRGGYLKASNDMILWMRGGLDVGKGTRGDTRLMRYRKLYEYDYYSERRMWWLLGYTKTQADALARQDLVQRFERFEEITHNRISMYGVVVKVYLASDEDREDELGENSLWNIESDSGDDYFTSVALDCSSEAIHEAEETIRKRVARYQPQLPGISP